MTLGVSHDEVVRIFDALHKVGWIDQAFLVTWYEHQPEDEDPTRYERVKRFRQKKHEEKQAESLARLRTLNPAAEIPSGVATPGLPETAFQSGETAFHHKHVGGVGPYAGPRNGVSAVIETPRSRPEKERGLSKEGKVEQQIPRADDLVWLYGRGGEGGRGLFLVMHGCQRGSELYARNLIAGWLRELGDCAERLKGIIEAVPRQATGAAYEQLITQHVAHARDLASGSPRLPLPPLPVVKTAGE